MLIRPLALGAVVAVPFLFGCNDSPSGPSYVTSADSAELLYYAENHQIALSNELGVLNSQFPSTAGFSAPATARERGRAAQTYVRGLLAALAQGGAPLPAAALAGPRAAPFSECDPVVTGVDSNGVAIDSDGDGIPDDFKIDFGSACVSADSAGHYRVTESGFLRVQDTGEGFFSYFITIGHQRTKDEDLTTGEVDELDVNGFEGAGFAATGANHTLSLSLTTTDVTGGVTERESDAFTRTANFVPDTGLVISLGNNLPPGTLHYAINEQAVNAFEGKNFFFSVATSAPLHFAPPCAYHFDAGTLRGMLNRDQTIGFQAVWTGCAAPTVTIFGNSEPPAAVAEH